MNLAFSALLDVVASVIGFKMSSVTLRVVPHDARLSKSAGSKVPPLAWWCLWAARMQQPPSLEHESVPHRKGVSTDLFSPSRGSCQVGRYNVSFVWADSIPLEGFLMKLIPSCQVFTGISSFASPKNGSICSTKGLVLLNKVFKCFQISIKTSF